MSTSNGDDNPRPQLRPTVPERRLTEEDIPTELIPENQPVSLTEMFLWATAGFLVVAGIAYWVVTHFHLIGASSH